MLVSALAATLVGFGLLVVALVTGTLWLAVACIVVCIAGACLLLADVLGLGDPIARRVAARRRARADRRAARRVAPDPAGDAVTEAPADGVTDDPVAAEVTTEFARIDAGPIRDVPEPVVDPVHHARHGGPDEPVDHHAHVRRDDTGRPAEVFRSSHAPHHSRHSAPSDLTDPDPTDPDAADPAGTAPATAGTDAPADGQHSRHRSRD